MEIDFLGARLDIDLIENLAESLDFSIFQDGKTTPQPLTDCSFSAVLLDQRGGKTQLETQKADNGEFVTVHFPALAVGSYEYEIWLLSSGGEQLLVRGRVGVFASIRAERLQAGAGERRSFNLRVPAVSGKRVQLMALSGNIAQMWAARAKERAESAQTNADAAKKAAQEAADEARKLIDIDEYIRQIKEGATEELEKVIEQKEEEITEHTQKQQQAFEDAVRDSVIQAEEELEAKRHELQAAIDEMGTLRAKVEELRKDIRDSVFIDDEGFIWIGGENTGHNATGEPGKSPYLDEDGLIHWWDAESQEWKEEMIKAIDGFSPYVNEQGYWVERDPETMQEIVTQYRAYGTDGIDGDSVVRHLVASVDEIPKSGDTCNGGHYYYVPKEEGDGYHVYAFLEDNSGRGAWYKVDEKNDISTPTVYGLNKLGTDLVIADGAAVGVNNNGQMFVPSASTIMAGAVKLSLKGELDGGGRVGVGADGELLTNLATTEEPGSVQLSYYGTDCEEVVGAMANGKLVVKRGAADAFGVYKAADLRNESAAAYIGVDDAGYLRLDIASNGIVRTSAGLSLSLGTDKKIIYSDDLDGLTVQDATTERAGVVRIAMSAEDSDAVPTMRGIDDILREYTKTSSLSDYVTIKSFDERLETALQSDTFDIVNSEQLDKKVTEINTLIDELKKSIADSDYVTSSALTTKLASYVTSSALTTKLASYLTQTAADKLYMSISNTPVMAYASYKSMPAVENQKSGVLYLGGEA